MEETSKIKMPYLSFKTFKNFLESLAANGTGLPGKIDRTVIDNHSGSVQSYLLNSLMFFSLIDADATPLGKLREFVASDEGGRQVLWGALLDDSYEEIHNVVEVGNCTEGQFSEAVRSLSGYSGETVRKAIAFYIALSAEAKREISPYLKPPKRTPRRRSAPKKRSAPKFVEPDLQPATDDGANTYRLQLTAGANPRCLEIKGPIEVTKSELERIQKWLEFHFIIVESAPPVAKTDVDSHSDEAEGIMG